MTKPRTRRANLGTIQVGPEQVRVWYEAGRLCFRRHRSRRTESISLGDTYHAAKGQLTLL